MHSSRRAKRSLALQEGNFPWNQACLHDQNDSWIKSAASKPTCPTQRKQVVQVENSACRNINRPKATVCRKKSQFKKWTPLGRAATAMQNKIILRPPRLKWQHPFSMCCGQPGHRQRLQEPLKRGRAASRSLSLTRLPNRCRPSLAR